MCSGLPLFTHSFSVRKDKRHLQFKKAILANNFICCVRYNDKFCDILSLSWKKFVCWFVCFSSRTEMVILHWQWWKKKKKSDKIHPLLSWSGCSPTKGCLYKTATSCLEMPTSQLLENGDVLGGNITTDLLGLSVFSLNTSCWKLSQREHCQGWLSAQSGRISLKSLWFSTPLPWCHAKVPSP